MLLETEAHETPLVDWTLQSTTMLDTSPVDRKARPAPELRRRASLRAPTRSACSHGGRPDDQCRRRPGAGPARRLGLREAGTVVDPPAPASPGVTIGGPSDVASQLASYAPGQSSGWHSHTGLHAVVVLSGTLTIVDGECQSHTYGAGDSYVGGRDVHVALNETATPLEMAVTYMFPAGVSHTGFHLPAEMPAGCEVR